jgi:FkbM family methyltransferase
MNQMFHFEEIVKPPAMVVVDIGAMLLDGQIDPFERLSELRQLRVIGFEPQLEECEKLNALARPGHVYLPHAIADGKRRTLHVTNTRMTSSLLPPNFRVIEYFNNLAEHMQVVATQEIDTLRLDDVNEICRQGCDLLKLDTQGSEAEILEHATKTLEKCLIVQCEVEFVQLYEGQLLFGDIDKLLRNRGFMLHRFSEMCGRTYKPLMVNNDPNVALSQVLWCDAIYVPNLTSLDGLEPTALVKLAALLHEVYGSWDLCHVVLAAHDRLCGTTYSKQYFDRLAALRSG